MSPAPHDPKSNRFSNRIRGNTRLSQDWPTRNDKAPCVWAIDNQLLFTEDVSPVADQRTDAGDTVDAWFRDNGIQLESAARLFADITLQSDPPVPDVHVVNVDVPDGQDIFSIARDVRNEIPGRERGVTPNHILIPAWNGDACPYGPPEEWGGNVPPDDVQQVDSVPITLLDSGYYWDDAWGRNPLAALGYQARPQQASYPLGGDRWDVFPPESYDEDGDQLLDALAGHANFVAGIIAQRTSAPLQVWNHNGSFVKGDLSSIASEASVLRSLVESQKAHPTPVIVVTYAFPAFEDAVSTGWDSVLNELRAIHGDNGFVIVCPVGNQGTHFRRYPAALHTVGAARTYRNSPRVAFPEVIGVGSLVPGGARGSHFSNFGTEHDPWVTCAAIGEEVVSTFLSLDLEPEDEPWPIGNGPGPHDFRGNAWAKWEGTCFAAPKVAVAIGHEALVNGIPPRDAFDAYIAPLGAPDPRFGITLPNL